MATMTGENLLQSIIDSTGVEINDLIFGTLSARLQQMIDEGTYSKLAAGIAMSGFSTLINDATEINELVDGIEANAALIAAADEGTVGDIVFSPIGGGGETEIFTLADALAAEDLPAEYEIDPDSDPVNLDGATVAEAEEAYGVVTGAANADDILGLFTWTVADTLENLEGAPEDVLAGADSYSLTDAETDLGELTSEQYLVAKDAANVADYTFTVVPADPESITAAASTVVEGNAIDFTVEMSHAVNVDRDLEFVIEGVATDAAQAANPLTDLGLINGSVTIPAGETTAVITLTPADDGETEGLEAFRVKVLDVDFNTVLTSGNVVIQDSPNAGQTFTLTTDVDEFVGGAGNDTFNATNTTLTALDSLDGGDGTDLLRINDTTGASIDFSVATIQNIETINLRSVGDVGDSDTSAALDASTITGLNTFNVLKAQDVLLKAAATTDVNISGATGGDGGTTGTGLIQVDGGKNVVVTDAAFDNDIAIGGTTAPAGTITVTDSAQGAAAIAVDGGTDVTVTTTSKTATGTITVGATTAATGTVNVTQNLESDGETALDNSGAGIAVTGGTSITINSNATSDAKDEDSNADITMHDISATGSEDTTEVTVTQTKTINTVSTPAEDEVKATHTVTFKALNAGQTTTLNGLTFTASTNLTAADVAQAFANLTVDDTQSETGPTANGFYSGAFNTASGWTSGAADGAKVVFTAPAYDTTDTTAKMVAAGDVAADVTAAIVAGSAAVAKDESANDITYYGDVAVDDHAGTADATITTVTLDGFDEALLGGTNSLDALTTLSLANGKSAELKTTQSALDLTVNNISSDLDLDGNSSAKNITDLNITTVGADSTIIFTATVVTDLTIDAAVDLDASGSAFDALENVTIAGAGAVILDGTTDDDTLATIDAANNEGGVTATVKGNVVVTGGDGNDTIEVSNDTITKAINLGAGDDTLTLFAGTTAGKISATVDGGIGSDTLSISSADAAANSTDTDFDNAVTGFEVLYINDAAGTTETTDKVTTTTINLANLAYSNVITSGTNIDTARDELVLDNLANNGMVVLNDDGDIKINVAGAAEGTADNLDLVVASTKGSVTANNVETINIDAVAGESKFALTADSVETISITGFEFVNLTSATDYTSAALGDTSTITSGTLTMIDASGMTDAGSVPVGGIAAATSLAEQTIKGSIGADYLTAAHSKAVIEGGDGADTIFVTDGATSAVIDGGAGADTFDITGAALGVEAFATFNNVDAGDKFLLNASSFSSDEVAMTLDDPSTSDYINAAFNQTAAGESIWFQHNDNTYIAVNATGSTNAYDAANDVVVKLTGLVDLSAASFNASGILEIA